MRPDNSLEFFDPRHEIRLLFNDELKRLESTVYLSFSLFVNSRPEFVLIFSRRSRTYWVVCGLVIQCSLHQLQPPCRSQCCLPFNDRKSCRNGHWTALGGRCRRMSGCAWPAIGLQISDPRTQLGFTMVKHFRAIQFVER